MDYADCPECAGEDFEGILCDYHEIKDLRKKVFVADVIYSVLFVVGILLLIDKAIGGGFKPRIPESKDPYTVEHSGSAWVTTDAKGERE